MKTADMKNIKVAKKYAYALIQTALSENSAEKILNDLIFVSETLNANKELNEFLLNPVIKIEDKKDIIEKIFKIHINKTTLDFLFLLADKNRLSAFNEILNRYTNLFDEACNIAKPVVISAVELDSLQKQRLTEKLANKLMKKILPEYIINPDIIGGLIIEIGDITIDGSIKTKFENMKKELTKGNRYGND